MTDVYEMFERFCIMAESIGDEKAIEFCKARYPDFSRLKKLLKKLKII